MPDNEQTKEQGGLGKIAIAIGTAAGKIAGLARTSDQPASTPKSHKRGKLPKKEKSRLPRRQKKARKKIGSAQPKEAGA